MSEVITYREFTSPHVYNYGDCTIYNNKPYKCINFNGTDGRTGFHPSDWSELESGVVTPDTSIQKTQYARNSYLLSVRKQLNFKDSEDIEWNIADDPINNKTDIIINELPLRRLFQKALFELSAQGIVFEDPELINEINKVI